MRRMLPLPALALAVVLAPVLTGATAGGPATQPGWCLGNTGDTTLAEPATAGAVFALAFGFFDLANFLEW